MLPDTDQTATEDTAAEAVTEATVEEHPAAEATEAAGEPVTEEADEE